MQKSFTNAVPRDLPIVGGQAVMEGVMMKGPKRIAIAVRTKKGIKIRTQPVSSFVERYRVLRFPFVRGVVFLFEMLVIGMNALTWSANQQLEKHEQLSRKQMAFTMVFSILLAVGLFVGLPYLLTRLFTSKHDLMFNAIDGGFRLGIFLIYLSGITLMKDVKRLFQYHGAEHKAVNCHEAGLQLTVKNVQQFTTVHPRCGTSLIVFVIALSILLFSLIRSPDWYVNVGMRIVAIPLLAGASYELLRLSGKYRRNLLLRVLVKPGLWVQKLTTRQPSNRMVEVSIASLKAALR
ncbi:DUF1385 domain-containing protein [Candidatus Woesearchaeota archaeon]|nr:DUF1385 domain-containing protein [Candidatus Woesearchaeota archaeon]